MASASRLRLVLALPFFVSVMAQTTCQDPTVTWWNNPDGETPCQQYERLRQICDDQYRIPLLNATAPGDICDSQQSDCCNNSISFTLSMLCLNCQQGTGSGREGAPAGIDAPHGTYQKYLSQAKGDPTNGSLRDSVQRAVCNRGIRLSNFHYEPFWPDGSWSSQVIREVAENNVAESDKCASFATRTPLAPGSASSESNPTSTQGKLPSTVTISRSPKQDNHGEQPPSSEAGASGSANTAVLLAIGLGGFIVILLLVALILHLLKLRRREKNRLPVVSISRSSTPDIAAPMLESQTASRAWTMFSDVPTSSNQSSRRTPDSTANVPLYHQASSYAPSSSHRTSDSYSTFIPPASSRAPSPPLPENPFSDRHKPRTRLFRQTLDTISSAPSYRS